MNNFSFSIFDNDAAQDLLLFIHEQIEELQIFFKMTPRTNFLLNAFNFYVRIKISQENHIVDFQTIYHQSSSLRHS